MECTLHGRQYGKIAPLSHVMHPAQAPFPPSNASQDTGGPGLRTISRLLAALVMAHRTGYMPQGAADSNHGSSQAGAGRHRFHKHRPAAGRQEDCVVAYTDGSCIGNGRAGAVAGYGVYFPASEDKYCGPLPAGSAQTNQRAELEAIRQALKSAVLHRALEIRTDSQYALKGLTEWSLRWRAKNWDVPVHNKDLFQEIIRVAEQQDQEVYMAYVPAHTGEPGNEMANALAMKGAKGL